MKIKTIFKPDEEITIEKYLSKMGIKDIDLFLKPNKKCLESPEKYENIERGYSLLKEHIDKGSTIYVLIDCDLDGYCSSAIIIKWLYALDESMKIFPIFHSAKIHGLDDGIVEATLKDESDVLLIIPDASSNDYELHEKYSKKGIDILILDHHQAPSYSESAIVINNQLSTKIENKSGSGALVTWKFCKYCDEKFGTNNAPELMELVYFSLISDSMSMTSYENRFISNWFLDKNHISHNLFKTLIALNIRSDDFSNKDIAFNVIPKLSAIIRNDDDSLKFDLFESLVFQTDIAIERVIKKSKTLSASNQKEIREYVNTHIEKVNNNRKIIIEECNDIRNEFRGLVASKYVSNFNKCVLLYSKLSNGDYSVSMRSILPLKDFLNDSGLISLQGHERACGGVIKANKLIKLIEFCKDAEIPQESITVAQSFDAKDIPDYLFGYFEKYKKCFGKDVEEPAFHIKNIKINSKDIAQLKGNTIKFRYKNIDFLKFFCSNAEKESVFHTNKNVGLNLEVIGQFSINVFNGKESYQVIIEKVESSIYEIDIDDLF